MSKNGRQFSGPIKIVALVLIGIMLLSIIIGSITIIMSGLY